jgi:hypothetical protein
MAGGRSHGAGHGDGGTSPPAHSATGGGTSVSPSHGNTIHGPTNVVRAQATTTDVALQGRPRSGTGGSSSGGASGTSTQHPDDAALRDLMDRYEAFGDLPPRFNIATNDGLYNTSGAHTVERHGPSLPLSRDLSDPTTRTVEGRIHGDPPWTRTENYSYRWTDHSTMNRTINDHIRENWDDIRSELVLNGRYRRTFDAHHLVGEGYYNEGMYGAGPISARYSETSRVTITIQTVPGSDPPQPFIVTAFPDGR